MEKTSVKVYIARIPDFVEIGEVFPFERNIEIQACKNKEKKKEKYCAWKLLELALKTELNEDIKNIKFAKDKNGKWECDKCYFSLSHSACVVAVAISYESVGVDIEKNRAIKTPIYKKILSDSEMQEMGKAENKNEYLIKKWTQKESVFKEQEKQEYNLKKADTKNSKTFTILQNNSEYFVSVATKNLDKITIIQDIKL